MTGRRWFTSVQHFEHVNVARRRGFATAEEMDALLIDNWCRKIAPDDIVYILGDITGLASGIQLDYMLHLIQDLPGEKHLICGNHDPVSSIHRSGWKLMRRYLEVFESVRDYATINIDGCNMLMSHYPYWGGDDERYRQYRLPDCGRWLLHGHTHLTEQCLHGKQIHVGVDAWDFKPVSESEIVKLARSTE